MYVACSLSWSTKRHRPFRAVRMLQKGEGCLRGWKRLGRGAWRWFKRSNNTGRPRIAMANSKLPVKETFVYPSILAVTSIGLSIFFFDGSSGASQVSGQFLAGVLTFDGIMMAAVAFAFPRSILPEDASHLQFALGPIALFVLSSLMALYMLLRLQPTPNGLAFQVNGDITSPAFFMLALTILGLLFWGYSQWLWYWMRTRKSL